MFRKGAIVEDDRGNAFEVLTDDGGATVRVQSVVTKVVYAAPRAEVTLVEGARARG